MGGGTPFVCERLQGLRGWMADGRLRDRQQQSTNNIIVVTSLLIFYLKVETLLTHIKKKFDPKSHF